MKVLSLRQESDRVFPAGLQRLEYQSAVDSFRDWALLLSGRKPSS